LSDEDNADRDWISQQVQDIHAKTTLQLQGTTDAAITSLAGGSGAGGGHWQTAFIVLLVVLGIFLFFAHCWYEHIRKSHLL
jgi:hypothetical protein